jgi:hypothetical protein
MDTLSHGLWGGVAFGRKSKARWWTAFAFGVGPDIVAFGPLFVSAFLGIAPWPHRDAEPPSPLMVPEYVYNIYDYSHSFVIFAAVFLIVWLIMKRPVMEMLAWPFHIILDIPTHSSQFFPTPFLWPLSKFHIDGFPWAHPAILIPNTILLALSYLWWYRRRKSTS